MRLCPAGNATCGASPVCQLPRGRDYVEFIERLLGVRVGAVSTGPRRHEIIRRK